MSNARGNITPQHVGAQQETRAEGWQVGPAHHLPRVTGVEPGREHRDEQDCRQQNQAHGSGRQSSNASQKPERRFTHVCNSILGSARLYSVSATKLMNTTITELMKKIASKRLYSRCSKASNASRQRPGHAKTGSLSTEPPIR